MKLKYIYSAILSCISALSLAQSPQVVDKIAAQIGDNIILLSDIQAQLLQLQQETDAPLEAGSDCQMLEELMFQNLLLHQAKIDSINIPAATVDAEMENRLRTLEQQIGSRQKLEEFYGKTTTEIKMEFREIIKERLLAQEMQRKITGEVSVTPKEVKAFYDKIPADSVPLINTQMSFQQIVHYPEITKADKKIAFDKLTEIRKNIVAGKKFETQASIHSMDPGSASQGGKISASKGMMVPPFEAAVFDLKEGEISEVFETTYGYHIVTLLERKGDDYTCRHILIMPEFSNDAINKSAMKIDSCFAALKAGILTWDAAVLKYSNDELTKENKGIITNPITGEQTWDMQDLNQVDHQIFVLTDAMEKGDISAPNLYVDLYERKQGVRIVRLMERTAPHRANLKEDYSLIKRAAENDKRQEIVNNWVQSKINTAYIRIDPAFSNCSFTNDWNPK
jgi:peptidyl-prolyl cis-trans isomerase SurA